MSVANTLHCPCQRRCNSLRVATILVNSWMRACCCLCESTQPGWYVVEGVDKSDVVLEHRLDSRQVPVTSFSNRIPFSQAFVTIRLICWHGYDHPVAMWKSTQDRGSDLTRLIHHRNKRVYGMIEHATCGSISCQRNQCYKTTSRSSPQHINKMRRSGQRQAWNHMQHNFMTIVTDNFGRRHTCKQSVHSEELSHVTIHDHIFLWRYIIRTDFRLERYSRATRTLCVLFC